MGQQGGARESGVGATDLLRARVRVQNELAVDERAPKRHHGVLMVREVKSLHLAIRVVAVDLLRSATGRSAATHDATGSDTHQVYCLFLRLEVRLHE